MRKKKCKLTTNKKNTKQLTYNNNNKLAYEETPQKISLQVKTGSSVLSTSET